MFSTSVCEEIQSYVYYLRDPRDDEVFYVGKGQGNRIFQHVDGNLESPAPSDRLDRIRSIQDSGESVQLRILRHGLSEEEAFEVEASLIDFIGLSNLTNVQGGRQSDSRGLKTPQALIAMYGAEEFRTSEPVMLFNLKRQYYDGIPSGELYEATRKSWKVDKRRIRARKAKYAIAVHDKITREVYEILEWHEVPYNEEIRLAFKGRPASTDVRDRLMNKSIANVKLSAQWTFSYHNC